MKHTITIILLVIANVTFAQAPQGIPYQAIARNSSGSILASQPISVRFSIRDSVAAGTIVYRETFTPTTNTLGLFNVNVGTGTVVTGTFSGINWGTNAKFMQVEMDPTGGTSYIDMGTQQMMSVPYAKYAETSGGVTGGGSAFTHYVGEVWGGGVVYHVYRGGDGLEHGLIVALTDQSTSASWSNVSGSIIGSSAQSSWDGMANSNAIIAQGGHTNSAAKLCLDLISGGFNDWYLPSIEELRLLLNMKFNVNKQLISIGGASQIVNSRSYWCSTEDPNGDAWFFFLPNGTNPASTKSATKNVRAIRSF